MKNYTKAVLYAYPLLKNIGEEYAVHIQNCAVLSYRNQKSAEDTALYIAEEIVRKRNLEWLKSCVERTLDKLSPVEKMLVQIRYFGMERKMKKATSACERSSSYVRWSDSKYFRMLRRISEKVGLMLEREGLSEEIFLRDFAHDELFEKIYQFVCSGRDKRLSKSERRWLA